METNYENQENYLKAQKEVGKLKSFYENLFSYICVNIILIIINLLVSPQHLWFFGPLLCWGVSVIIHAMYVFNWSLFLGKNWEEKKLKAFIEEEKNKENNNKKS